MKKILVPTDFSECAIAAQNIGLEFAKLSGAEIHFLHCIDTPVDWLKLPLEKEKLFPEVKSRINHARAELNKLKKSANDLGLKSSEFISFDKGMKEIDDHIKNHEHDFVVMGSHGARGFKEIIGSNAQNVVRHSPTPVLVVKQRPNPFKIENIVYASSFENTTPPEDFIRFSKMLKAKVHFLFINTPYNFIESDQAEMKMKASVELYPEATLNVFNALNEIRGVEKFAESINADLIAMTTEGKTGFLRMLSPSVAEGLVNRASIPVLCYKNVNTL